MPIHTSQRLAKYYIQVTGYAIGFHSRELWFVRSHDYATMVGMYTCILYTQMCHLLHGDGRILFFNLEHLLICIVDASLENNQYI